MGQFRGPDKCLIRTGTEGVLATFSE
eukprot:g10819.t1